MDEQINDAAPDLLERIDRHRARQAVLIAGLPLYRALVDRAVMLAKQHYSVAEAALILKSSTARLPR